MQLTLDERRKKKKNKKIQEFVCFCGSFSLLRSCVKVLLFLCVWILFRAQELCESPGGRPGLPVPNSPYGFCGRSATLNLNYRVQGLCESRGGRPGLPLYQPHINLMVSSVGVHSSGAV